MESTTPITRRKLLAGAAAGALGGAATLTYRGIPAWAKPIATAAAVRRPDSLPFPHLPAGDATPGLEEIEHVVVLMMENHSFDNMLGMVPQQVPGREHVDGFSFASGIPTNWNPTTATPAVTGPNVVANLATSPCQVSGEPDQGWNESHLSYNNGLNNGFVQASTDVAMWYWDRGAMPFTYSMAEHFPIGQRYFCSVLAQTDPNRRFLFCGTASGLTATSGETFTTPAANGTIFERLLHYKISWLNYVQPTQGSLQGSALLVPNFAKSTACTERMVPINRFFNDAKHGKLPEFSFIDPNYGTTSEENPQDIQYGERFVASIVDALMKSPNWSSTAFFLMYDEHGGYYDHVPPPAAIAPDSIAPSQALADETLVPGGYNQYGFRVPLFVVSPWAKKHYVSSIVQDHTSILAFIERKWNLPAMTFRDANAHPMIDYFDFKKPAFLKPPKLAAAPPLAPGLAECTAAGLTPPPDTAGD